MKRDGHAAVVISGWPASGKSTIAAALARALGLPVLSKDWVKEALWDAMGPGDFAWSRSLGAAANEVILSLAAELAVTIVDSFWRRDEAALRWGRFDPVIELFCSCPSPVARRRYAERAPHRHASHFDAARLDDPGLGSTQWDALLRPDAIVVDSTAPVDLEPVLSELRGRLGPLPEPPHPRQLILVAGLPGAGKSTLCAALASRLHIPIIGQDWCWMLWSPGMRTWRGPATIWRCGAGSRPSMSPEQRFASPNQQADSCHRHLLSTRPTGQPS